MLEVAKLHCAYTIDTTSHLSSGLGHYLSRHVQTVFCVLQFRRRRWYRWQGFGKASLFADGKSLCISAKDPSTGADLRMTPKAWSDGQVWYLTLGEVVCNVPPGCVLKEVLVGVTQIAADGHKLLDSQTLLVQPGQVSTEPDLFPVSSMQQTEATKERSANPVIKGGVDGAELSGLQAAYKRTYNKQIVVPAGRAGSYLYLNIDPAHCFKGFKGCPVSFALQDHTHPDFIMQRTHMVLRADYAWFRGIHSGDTVLYHINMAVFVEKRSKIIRRWERARHDMGYADLYAG